MQSLEAVASVPELAAIAAKADRVYVIHVECRKSLREFMAAALSYMPGWMRLLYRVRWVFVRLLGTSQDGVPSNTSIAPKDIPFTTGQGASIFTVTSAREGTYWLGEATDKMITGYLGVVAEPLGNDVTRFHLFTLAKFHRRVGRFYFAVITPFHHLVVFCMARKAAGGEVRGSQADVVPESAQ